MNLDGAKARTRGKRDFVKMQGVSRLALASMMLATPGAVWAQDGTSPTTQIIVDSNDSVDSFTFNEFTQISPVLLSGDGDVLLRASSFGEDNFVAFTGSASLLSRAFPNATVPIDASLGVSSVLANFSVSSATGQLDSSYAVFGRLAADGNQLYLGQFDDTVGNIPQLSLQSAIAGQSFADAGNLFSGAIPLVSGDEIALLVSNITVQPNSFDTTNVVAFSSDFGASYSLLGGLEGSTSLRFAGDGRLFGSTSNQIASQNSAILDSILVFDADFTNADNVLQLGPNAGGFNYGGFDFFTSAPGSAGFGEGVQYLDRRFSVVGDMGVFALSNVEAALDGTPGEDIVTQAIFMQSVAGGEATGEALLVLNTASATSIGNVRFESVDDLTVSATGEVFFSGRAVDVGTNGILPVSYWRIENPGAANQTIVPVLAPGAQLQSVDGQQFTILGQPTGFTERSLAIDTTLGDGRAQLISVNDQGLIALYAYLDLGNGNSADALVAQADDGTFFVVAYEGQQIEVDGQMRTVADFTFQFGSNDVDGHGDGFNSDEQLAYQLLFADNSFAVALTDLNGSPADPDITRYLWQGGCGDDEFSTLCAIGGDDGSNWVNADDNSQIADGPPGSSPAPQIAIIRGEDVRIAVADVAITSIDSDSKLTLQDGRSLTLSNGGSVDNLVIEDGTLNVAGLLATDRLQLTSGTVDVSGGISVADALVVEGGTLRGDGGIEVRSGDAITTSRPVARFANRVELDTSIGFETAEVTADDAAIVMGANGVLNFKDRSKLTMNGGAISGDGEVFFDAASTALITTDESEIFSKLRFENADAARLVDSEDELITVATGSLTVHDLAFLAPGLSDIAINSGAGVLLIDGTRFVVAENGSLSSDAFLEFKGAPLGDEVTGQSLVFENNATLSIGTSGTVLLNLGENGTTTLKGTTVNGGGLLANLGTLAVEDSSFEVVFGNIGSASFTGTNTIATSDDAARLRIGDRLFQRGVELVTGIAVGDEGNPLPVSALLNDATFGAGTTTISGDGVAFLVDTTLTMGAQLDSTARTLLGGDMSLGDNTQFSVTGDLAEPAALAILATSPNPTNTPSADLRGTGKAVFDTVELQGLTSENSDQFRFATLRNGLGSAFVQDNPRLIEGLDVLQSDPASLMTIENSSLRGFRLLNEGVLKLDLVTFEDDADIRNRGLLVLSDVLIDTASDAAPSSIVNDINGRIQITEAGTYEVLFDNIGTITVNAVNTNEVPVTFALMDVVGGGLLRGELRVTQGNVTVLETNALSSAETAEQKIGPGNGRGLTGRFSLNASTLTLLDETGNAPTIGFIAEGGEVVLNNGSTFHNLQDTITGLRVVEGTLVAQESALQGDNLLVGNGGIVSVRELDLGTDGTLVVGSASELQTDVYRFGEAFVDGRLTLTDLAGSAPAAPRDTPLGSLTLSSEAFAIISRNDEDAIAANFQELALGRMSELAASSNIVAANRFTMADNSEASFAGLQLGTFALSGNAALRLRDLSATSGEVLDDSTIIYSGAVTADSLTVAGSLRQASNQTPNISETLRNPQIGTLSIADGGEALFGLTSNGAGLEINLLDVAEGGTLMLAELAGSDANRSQINAARIDGSIVFSAGAEVDLDFGELTLSQDAMGMFAGGDLSVFRLLVDGTLVQAGKLVIRDSLFVSEGGTLQADELTIPFGEIADIGIRGGRLIVGKEQIPRSLLANDLVGSGVFDITGNAEFNSVDLSFSNTNNWMQRGGDLRVNGGDFAYNNGDFALLGNALGLVPNMVVFGSATFGSETGNILIEGDLNARGLTGYVTGAAAVRTVTVQGDANLSGIWTIDRGLSVSQTLAVEDLAQLNGDIVVMSDAFVGEQLLIDDNSRLQVNGTLEVGQPDTNTSAGITPQAFTIAADGDEAQPLASRIDGTLVVGGNATFDLVEVTGTLGVGGTLEASEVMLTGTAQIGRAEVDTLTIASNATLLAASVETNGDFTNLGTYQLGDPESGPGTFVTGGTFLQGGVFSGAGTIEGNLVQESVAGGLAGSDLLFSPGFSPEIVNISGDATFNEGMIVMEIGGLTPGLEHDQVNVGGTLTFGPDAMLVVDLLELDDGSGIFLPRTGDEIVLFTANGINPTDVADIQFAVLDDLPLGFTIVPDIVRSGDGDLLRVLRGFDGSMLADLSGLDSAQAGVAEAIDFLSSAESGVPSEELFNLAVELQFADDALIQQQGLTQLSGTTLTAIQSTAIDASQSGMAFAQDRLRLSRNASRASDLQMGAANPSRSSADRRRAAMVASAVNGLGEEGNLVHGGGDGAGLRLVGQAGYTGGGSDPAAGVIGFDQESWAASLGLEYNTAGNGMMVGGSLTYADSEGTLDNGLGQANVEAFGATIYGQAHLGAVTLSAGVSLAEADIDSTRAAISGTASSRTDAQSLHLFGAASARLLDTSTWVLGPELEVAHSDLDIDGFTEQGAGPLSLAFGSMSRQASYLELSAFAARHFAAGEWNGAVRFEAGYRAALAADGIVQTEAAFAVAPATTFNQPLGPIEDDAFALSAGVSFLQVSGVEIDLGYDGLIGANTLDAHSVRLQLALGF